MRGNLHIVRYKGNATVVIKYDSEMYLLIGKKDRKKSCTRKAILWGQRIIRNPEQLKPFSEYVNNLLNSQITI